MKKALPIFISVIVILFGILKADAAGNVLLGVNIITEPDSYTIELISDKSSNITKRIVSANRVIINLKNTEISDNLSAKFDGNTVMDNIIVEPDMFGNVNILVQGKNIAYSDVKFRQPTALEKTGNSVISAASPILSAFSNKKNVNKLFQYFTLLVFGIVLMCEIRFIKLKYAELEAEKRLIIENTTDTSGFKDLMPGYGAMGLKKPYTTPIYTNPLINRLKNFRIPETATLSTLSVDKSAKSIMSDITSYTCPALTVRSINVDNNTANNARFHNVSNPIKIPKLKSSIKQLEKTTELYLDRFPA